MNVHFHQEGQHVDAQTNIGAVHMGGDARQPSEEERSRALEALEGLIAQALNQSTGTEQASQTSAELRAAHSELQASQPEQAVSRLERLKQKIEPVATLAGLSASIAAVIKTLAG